MGREARQGTVVYVAGEGHRGFGRRREAWGLQHGVDTRGAPVYLSKGPADMLAAVEDVKEAVAALPAPPAMIVFDTLARNFGGGDENSTKDMSAFVAALDHLKADYPDCVVLVVHHSDHQEKQRARGAMALKGAVDAEYRIEAKQGALKLTNTKMKDCEPPAPLHMMLQPTGGSAVLVEDSSPGRAGQLPEAQRIAKAAFIEAAKANKGDAVPTEEWRRAFYRIYAGSQDAKKKAFGRAREEIIDKGYLKEESRGFVVVNHDWQLEINPPFLLHES